MESAAWSAETGDALEAVASSAAALAALTGAGVDRSDVPDGGLPGSRSGVDPRRNADPSLDADPLRELADACLDGMAETARMDARNAALKVRFAADYVRATRALAPPAVSLNEATAQEMALVAEVACVLTISERAARALLVDSLALTTTLPLTLAALQEGTISWAHARIMVDETANLDPEAAAALEAHFLDPAAPDPARGCPAGELVPGRFRAKARTWRERHHPVSIETRHRKCVADRRVEFVPDNDGMAWLNTYLPAETAAGIWNRTTAAARALQGPDEPRTLTQLRADIAATLLFTNNTGDTTGGTAGATDNAAGGDILSGEIVDGGVPVPRAQVLVTVPVMSLLGVTEEPAMLDGYGPIPPSMARRLVAGGADSFHRVLVDPRDGAPLEIGRSSYRVTKALRQWLRLRDSRCPFPGCNNPSLDNDADHLLAWADGGTTGIMNLGQPCRKHHRLKHISAWTPTGASKDDPPAWISPSGRTYASEHQDWEPPHWPENMLVPAAPGPDLLPVHPQLQNPQLQYPEPEWPADPFVDWDQFTRGLPSCEPCDEIDPELPPDPGWDPDVELPPDPGRDPDLELPPDPFPHWSQFTAGHQFAAAETHHPDWPAPLTREPLPDHFLLHGV